MEDLSWNAYGVVIERFWFKEAQEDAPKGRNADVEIFHSRADLLADA